MEVPQKEPTPNSTKKSFVLNRHAHPGMAKYTAELMPHERTCSCASAMNPLKHAKGNRLTANFNLCHCNKPASVSMERHCSDLLFLGQAAALVSILLTNILKSVHLLCQPASLILQGTQVSMLRIPSSQHLLLLCVVASWLQDWLRCLCGCNQCYRHVDMQPTNQYRSCATIALATGHVTDVQSPLQTHAHMDRQTLAA